MTASNLLAEIPERRSGFLGDNREFVASEFGNEILDKHGGIFAPRKNIVKPGLCNMPVPLYGGVRLNGGMNKYQCRKQWLRAFRDTEGGINKLAEKLDANADNLSAILGPKAKRNVGDDLARRLKRVYHLPAGTTDFQSEEALQILKESEGLSKTDVDKVIAFIKFTKVTKN